MALNNTVRQGGMTQNWMLHSIRRPAQPLETTIILGLYWDIRKNKMETIKSFCHQKGLKSNSTSKRL